MSQQLNLYNPALRPRRDCLSARNVALATAVVLVVVLISGSIASSRLAARRIEAQQAADQLKPLQARLAELNQKLKTLHPDAALQARLNRLTRQVEGREAVLTLLESGAGAGKGYSAILSGLARQTTKGLWLTQVDVTGASHSLELHGRTVERSLVTDYLHRLDSEPVFAGRSFSGLKIEWPSDTGKTGEGKEGPKDREAAAPPYLEFVLMAPRDDAPRPASDGQKAAATPSVTDKEKRP